VTKDHEKKGYEKKLAEEKEKLATLNAALEGTKQEYEVRAISGSTVDVHADMK